MKKFLWILSLAIINQATAATQWWKESTVCRIDPSKCYSNMGIGYDAGWWDAGAKCWGVKMICPDAQINGNQAAPIGRNEIAAGTRLNPDYDTNILNGDCFGARKTKNNGTQVSVNGKYVNVWCNNVLDNPDEQVANGEISYNIQPTCNSLAKMGYVAVLNNNKCYGKQFREDEYFIDCKDSDLLPDRLVILNGANYTTGPAKAPTDQAAANEIFNKMYKTSKELHNKYFK